MRAVEVICATTRLNVHSLPDHSSEILHDFPAGIMLERIGSEKDGYTPIRFNGGTGWVKSAYVEAVILT